MRPEYYNPFPGARWLRYSLCYLNKNTDKKYHDEFVFIMKEMGWSKIPCEL